jgi:hypothetical protein
MLKRMLLTLLVSFSLGGCGLMSQKRAELSPTREAGGLGELVTLPAQLRTVTVKKTNNSLWTCAEPGPDVALSDTFKLVSGISAENTVSATDGETNSSANTSRKLGATNDLQTTTTALELAGRTQTVLLAREFMFRTCEAAANGWLKPEHVQANHAKVIENITKLIESDKAKADTQKAKAETAATAAAAALDEKILQSGAAAVKAALVNACTNTLAQCLSKPGIDDKGKAACQTAFIGCIK